MAVLRAAIMLPFCPAHLSRLSRTSALFYYIWIKIKIDWYPFLRFFYRVRRFFCGSKFSVVITSQLSVLALSCRHSPSGRAFFGVIRCVTCIVSNLDSAHH